MKLIAQGWKEEDIIEEYPVLKNEDIRAVLLFAEKILEEAILPKKVDTTKKVGGSNLICMKITYTSHLEFRLRTRNISYDLPRKVFMQAKEHYYDNSTKHFIP